MYALHAVDGDPGFGQLIREDQDALIETLTFPIHVLSLQNTRRETSQGEPVPKIESVSHKKPCSTEGNFTDYTGFHGKN